MPVITSGSFPTTNTVSTMCDTWIAWTADSTAATTTTTWDYWVDGTGYTPAKLTENQIRENNRIQTEREKRYLVEKKQRELAINRAKALLLSSLTEEQAQQYDKDKSFIVIGHKTKRKYRVRHGRAGNVDLLDGNRVRHRLCAHPELNVPDQDTMLAQKLMIECNEEHFLNLANVN